LSSDITTDMFLAIYVTSSALVQCQSVLFMRTEAIPSAGW